MTFAALFILAVGLGSDAFAAAVAKGAATDHPRLRDAIVTAAYFGFAEGLMVALGFALGAGVGSYIESVDHWIAFVLLTAIAGKMIRDGLTGGGEDDPPAAEAALDAARRTPLGMIALAIGTSIDSAVVGVTLALVGVPVALAAPLIGVISFTMSLTGVLLGRKLGPLLGRKAEILGGIVLFLIGLSILIEHLDAA